MHTVTRYTHADSPLGRLLLVGRGGALAGLYVADHDRAPSVDPAWVEDDGALGAVLEQLEQYFAGARRRFALRVEPQGTPFQRHVWHELTRIGYGRTISYGQLAQRIGRPGAARAVGLANGSNPVSIVVPCHRVIGADGSLTGYGWGTDRKDWLLRHEQREPVGV
ncbi:MAG TPA: methylated-DNA--[protein]-cysteine S-methyltransferase [Nitriliruptorales bacterium]